MLKAGLLLSVLFAFVSSAFSQAAPETVATASLQEEDKFSEILSYIAMGVGTIGVIWIAYFLSNKKGGSRTPQPTIRHPRRATR
jgi:hypothetical protein